MVEGGKALADNLVNTKDSPDIHTSIDIAATVERIKDDAVFALVPVVNDDRMFVLFRHEHCGLPGRAQRVDHDVIREHIQLFLFLALHIGLASETDPWRLFEYGPVN